MGADSICWSVQMELWVLQDRMAQLVPQICPWEVKVREKGSIKSISQKPSMELEVQLSSWIPWVSTKTISWLILIQESQDAWLVEVAAELVDLVSIRTHRRAMTSAASPRNSVRCEHPALLLVTQILNLPWWIIRLDRLIRALSFKIRTKIIYLVEESRLHMLCRELQASPVSRVAPYLLTQQRQPLVLED